MNQKRETFRSVTLWTWILVQGIVTPIFCFYPSAPTEARVRWVAVVAVLLTLIYGLTVGDSILQEESVACFPFRVGWTKNAKKDIARTAAVG